MLCEKCNKNTANVHFVKIINGVKQEMNICEKCAKDLDGVNFVADKSVDSPFYFQSLISGIMDYIGQTSKDTTDTQVTCSNCGMTYSEFKKNGLMGCSECYKEFNSTVVPVIKRVQGNVEHVGKVPNKAGKGLVDRKNLMKLKEELQRCILEEEYERAAEIRDEIKALQQKMEE